MKKFIYLFFVLSLGLNYYTVKAQTVFPLGLSPFPPFLVFDGYGNKLTNNQLLELSYEFGFDYDFYKQTKTWVNTSTILIGATACVVFPLVFILNVKYGERSVIPLACVTSCYMAGAITLACIATTKLYRFNRYLDSYNAKMEISTTSNGTGLVFRF